MKTRALLVVGLVALGGCTQSTPNGNGIVVIEQPLSGFWFYSWGCAGACADLDMGTDTDRTCFLAGVRGNLTPNSHVIISRSGGHYHLGVTSGPANPLMADVACMASTTNRTGEFLQVGNGTTTIPAGTAGRRCFLTSILTNAAPANAFSSNSDHARLTKNADSSWTLTNSQSTSPYASAYIGAVCVDVTSTVTTGLEQAPDPGTATDVVVPSSLVTACALTGIGGHFNANDYNDGARLSLITSYSDGGPSSYEWDVTANNGKRAWYTCVK